MPAPAPLAPHDAAGGMLATVLPSVATSIGIDRMPGTPVSPLPPARRAVVVLVDGLGHELLRSRAGHAPFLRSQLPAARRLAAGFPSTTATSMGSFGTGRSSGEHGLLGYEVLIPGEDRLLNELSWEDGPVPETWQVQPTVFEQAERSGVVVTRIGPGFFDGSGLTRAALRGGRFVAADSLAGRVDAALEALRRDARALVYVYWGDLDKVGHVHGCGSWEWGEELTAIDGELARLARSVPSDTAVHITADHGMIDAPHALRIDVAHDPGLARGIRHVGGEFRAPQLYCEAGAVDDVRSAWESTLGDRAWLRSRDEAIDAGWFGAVADRNRPRIGDLVVAMRETFAVVDSRTARPQLLALHGLHGSLTEAEVAIPWFAFAALDST
ncbi:MAG: alkaline phosphatase family protein [Nostocoides sp.]